MPWFLSCFATGRQWLFSSPGVGKWGEKKISTSCHEALGHTSATARHATARHSSVPGSHSLSLPVLTECSCPVWIALRSLFVFCLYSLYLPGALYMLRESQEWNLGLVAMRSVLFPPARTMSACKALCLPFLTFTLNTGFLFSGAIPIHSLSFPGYIICFMNMSSKCVLYCPQFA